MIYYILTMLIVVLMHFALKHIKINTLLKKYIFVYLSLFIFLFVAFFVTLSNSESESFKLLLEHSADKTFLKDYMNNYGIGYLVFIQTIGKFSLLNLIIIIPAFAFILISFSTFIIKKIKYPFIITLLIIIFYSIIRYKFVDYNQLAIFMALGILLTSIDSIVEKKIFTFTIFIVLSYTFYDSTIWFILVFFIYWLSKIKLKTAPKFKELDSKIKDII